MKQQLGRKKILKISAILGQPVHVAYANGYGRPHSWAEVQLLDGSRVMVNWNTGESYPFREGALAMLLNKIGVETT